MSGVWVALIALGGWSLGALVGMFMYDWWLRHEGKDEGFASPFDAPGEAVALFVMWPLCVAMGSVMILSKLPLKLGRALTGRHR